MHPAPPHLPDPCGPGAFDEHFHSRDHEVDGVARPLPGFRVVHFQRRGRLSGSDGSTRVLLSSRAVTVNATGKVVVDRSVTSCQ